MIGLVTEEGGEEEEKAIVRSAPDGSDKYQHFEEAHCPQVYIHLKKGIDLASNELNLSCDDHPKELVKIIQTADFIVNTKASSHLENGFQPSIKIVYQWTMSKD